MPESVARNQAFPLQWMVCSGLSQMAMFTNVKVGKWNAQKLDPSHHKYCSCQVYTEQSYLSEGHVCPVVNSKDHAGAFHFECFWTESPCVKGMVWGTSQGAWLDPAPAAVLSSGGCLWSSTVSRVPSHHFQGVTQDEKSGGLQEQAEFCFASLLILN